MKHPLTILLTLALATAVAGAAPRQQDSGKVPDDWRAALPEPVLGAHPEWVDFYYDTWRIAKKELPIEKGQDQTVVVKR